MDMHSKIDQIMLALINMDKEKAAIEQISLEIGANSNFLYVSCGFRNSMPTVIDCKCHAL